MPASVRWDNDEKTIIRQKLVGDWTYEEYIRSAAETQELTGSMTHTVHVIIDFTESRAYPSRLLAAGQALDRNFPSNQGTVTLIQCPAYVRAVFDIVVRLYPKIGSNSAHVNTLEEAYTFIHQYEAATE